MNLLQPRLVTPCVLLRRTDDGALDEYGNPTRTETRTDSRCRMDAIEGGETVDGAEHAAMLVLFGDDATDLTAHDAIEVDGLVYDFIAAPLTLRDVLGRVRHVEASVRRAS